MMAPGNRMDDLPDEVVVEILLRLPLLSAHRSKLICKRWYALLSSPFFARCFARNPKFFSILAPCDDNETLFSSGYHQFNEFKSLKGFNLSFLPQSFNRSPPKLLASCKDLLLCQINAKKGPVYVVCNPITQQSVPLPPIPSLDQDDPWADSYIFNPNTEKWQSVPFFPPPPPFDQYGLSLASHRFNGLLCYSSSRYAVVSILFLNYYNNLSYIYSDLKLQVFYSHTFVWSEKTISCHIGEQKVDQDVGIPYNGLLFWLLEGLIMVVDPFNLCNFPAFYDTPNCDGIEYGRLGVCSGCVRLFQVYDSSRGMLVWDLKHYDMDDNSSAEWVLYHEVVFQVDPSTPPTSSTDFYLNVLGCHPDNNDLVYISVHDPTEEEEAEDVVVSYNLSEQHFEVLAYVKGISEVTYACTLTLPWQPTSLDHPSPQVFSQNEA